MNILARKSRAKGSTELKSFSLLGAESFRRDRSERQIGGANQLREGGMGGGAQKGGLPLVGAEGRTRRTWG